MKPLPPGSRTTRKYQVTYRVPGYRSMKRDFFRALTIEQARVIATNRTREMGVTLLGVALCPEIK